MSRPSATGPQEPPFPDTDGYAAMWLVAAAAVLARLLVVGGIDAERAAALSLSPESRSAAPASSTQ